MVSFLAQYNFNSNRSKAWFFTLGLVLGFTGLTTPGFASAENCLKITLTGTQGGPPIFNGQAGAGTLVQYGEKANNCSGTELLFDVGRGTNQQLSKLRVPAGKLNAVFLTHLHSDHTEGLSDVMQLRWHFNSAGPKVDLICAGDTKSPAGHTMSCQGFATHIGDALKFSGELGQRLVESIWTV